MEAITDFLQGKGLALLVGVVIPWAMTKFVKNDMFYKWGKKARQKAEIKGKAGLKGNWVEYQRTVTGALLAFAEGWAEGTSQTAKYDKKVER